MLFTVMHIQFAQHQGIKDEVPKCTVPDLLQWKIQTKCIDQMQENRQWIIDMATMLSCLLNTFRHSIFQKSLTSWRSLNHLVLHRVKRTICNFCCIVCIWLVNITSHHYWPGLLTLKHLPWYFSYILKQFSHRMQCKFLTNNGTRNGHRQHIEKSERLCRLQCLLHLCTVHRQVGGTVSYFSMYFRVRFIISKVGALFE